MKKEILNKIKKGEVKMKPRWKFVAEDVGVKTAATILIFGAAIGMSMVGVFVKLYNPIELTSYGEVGWQLIGEDFPYLWLIGGITLAIIGWYMEQKIGNNYKKNWQYWAAITSVAIIILTTIILVLNLVGR